MSDHYWQTRALQAADQSDLIGGTDILRFKNGDIVPLEIDSDFIAHTPSTSHTGKQHSLVVDISFDARPFASRYCPMSGLMIPLDKAYDMPESHYWVKGNCAPYRYPNKNDLARQGASFYRNQIKPSDASTLQDNEIERMALAIEKHLGMGIQISYIMNPNALLILPVDEESDLKIPELQHYLEAAAKTFSNSRTL